MENERGKRVIELLEEERKRLAREIHDGPAQSLTNVTMRIEVVKKLLESDRQADAFRELERLQGLMRSAINDTRRMIFDLRPTFLEGGIHDAIVLYAERFAQMFGLPVKVTGDWNQAKLGHAVEVTLFRVYQEALHNVHKHARATVVHATLDRVAEGYQMSIVDDGVGFSSPARIGSYGLQGMKERMSLIGGMVRVESQPGQGTRVICEVPGNDG